MFKIFMKSTIIKGGLVTMIACLLLAGVQPRLLAENIASTFKNYRVQYRNQATSRYDQELKEKIRVSTAKWKKKDPLNGKFYTVGVLRGGENWGIVSMTSLNLEDPDVFKTEHLQYDNSNTFNVIFAKSHGKWIAALDDDDYVTEVLNKIPESELEYESKSILNRSERRNQAKAWTNSDLNPNAGYRLPWLKDQNWTLKRGYTGYWHPTNSLDFQSPLPANQTDILVMTDGHMRWVCQDFEYNNAQAIFRKYNSTEETWYGHISADTVQGVPHTGVGRRVESLPSLAMKQGDRIGTLLDIDSR
jgi:hypothetical protein